ncbi:MAG: hypothetical protein AB8I08_10120 [Sandaracinaceae bacterium]
MRRVLLSCAGVLAILGCDPGPGPIPMTDGGDPGMDAGRDIRDCPPGQTFCNGRCLPTATNPLHCGMCGNVCAASETCEDGMCRGAVECPSGQQDCGGGCTDVSGDNDHCGRCGEACGDNATCTDGACIPDSCPSEEPDRCEGACTNTQEDNGNCGSCGMKCALDQTCMAGGCVSSCEGTTCEVDGASVCVDTDSDSAHCGACNDPCDAGQACSSGSCGCSSGQETCGGRCVDTRTDPANCGDCGTTCDSGSACVSGSCQCPTDLTECGGSCVNTDIAVAHCGGCNDPCSGSQVCQAGSCVTSCGLSLTECGADCIDTSLDANHCGSCGNVCDPGLLCITGVCRPRNDDRINAITLTLPGDGSELVQRGTTDGATPDLPALSCAANGPNIWYRVIVPPGGGVLYADTAMSGYDTAIFVTDDSGTQVSGMCSDDCECDDTGDFEFLESCTARYVDAGTYFISVGGYSVSQTGDFSLHVQFLPDTGITYRSRINDSGTTSETFLVEADEAAATCGGAGTGLGGEDMRWFFSCGGDDTHLLSVCPADGGLWRRDGTGTDEGETYDPVLYVRSGLTGTETVCVDDDFTVNCSPEEGGSRFGARIPDLEPGRGIHGVIIDNRSLFGGGMRYQLRYELPDLEL